MTVNPIAFFCLAALILGAAGAVVTLRNIVHAAFALIGCMFWVGALYLTVGADFLAGAQVVIYAGAIPVLIIFAIMLTRGATSAEGNGLTRWWPGAAGVAAAVIAALVAVLASAHEVWRQAPYPQEFVDNGTTEAIGRSLLREHALPFEVASVLLLVALVGAVTLARRDAREERLDRDAEARRLREERARRRSLDRRRARQRIAGAAPPGADAGGEG